MIVVFLILVSLMIVIVAVSVTYPLWRIDPVLPRSRANIWVFLGLILLTPTLYLQWGYWRVLSYEGEVTLGSLNDTPEATVGQLVRSLEKQPEDVMGWLKLGRSYSVLGQFQLAQRAYQRADRVGKGLNSEALTGLGEVLMQQAEGKIDSRAGRLFERALQLNPNSERALVFGAIAAQQIGDVSLAIKYFEKLLSFSPPSEVRLILEKQIFYLQNQPIIKVNIDVAKNYLSQINIGDSLFVFVRALNKVGPPLAAKRLPAQLPVTVELRDIDSMLPGNEFKTGDNVEVSAKISHINSATPMIGDLIGSVAYIVGTDKTKNILINRVKQ